METARILIVEDDAVLALHLQQLLGQLGYHVAGLAATGEAAIQLALEQRPDAILMDIRLSGAMTGIQAAEAIHQHLDLPVVYLTAYDDDTVLRQARATGPYAYLVKPVRDQELRAGLEIALYKHASEGRIHHLNQVLRAVRDIDKLITHESDPQQLMDTACAILMRTRGYRFAWIGQPAGTRLKLIARAGDDQGLIARIVATVTPEQGQRLPGTQASRDREPVVCHDILHDDRYAPWWTEAAAAGFQSTIAVPLVQGGRLFGVLSVYSDQSNIFDFEEVDLLRELAEDLALGLKSLEDAGERLRAEQALRESEERYRLLLEHAPVGVAVHAGGKIIFVNSAGAALLGAPSPEAVVGRSIHDVVPPESWGSVGSRMGRLVAGETGLYPAEDVFMRLDGTRLPVEVRATVVDYQGQAAIQIIISDISQRRQAEAEITKLHRAVESLGEAVFLTDRQGVFTYVNPEFTRLYGYAAAEVVGHRTPRILKGGQLPPERYTALWQALLDNQTIRGEWVNRAKDGRLIAIEGSSGPVLDKTGTLVGFLSVQRDITERKRAEEKLQLHLDRLTAMREIDRVITASFDLRLTLGLLLTHVNAQLTTDAADVLLYNPGAQVLEYVAGSGFRSPAIERTQLRLGEGYAGRAALENRATFILNLAEQPTGFLGAPRLASEGFVSYYAIPLIAKGQIKGVLEIFKRAPLQPTEEWLDFLHTLAEQAAIAIDNAMLFESLQHSHAELTQAYDATIEGWSRALDLRDRETEGHTRRVTEVTLQLARALSFSDADLVHIRRGALLHDIGKMGVPDGILLKPGPLTDDEWVIMKKHPVFAYEMLAPIAYLRPALDIPYCHHEKWDGTGYPRGLRGAQIPLMARIFAVVDVWDALLSDRPYRRGWPEAQVLNHLRSLAGTHFDPDVVTTCLAAGVFALATG